MHAYPPGCEEKRDAHKIKFDHIFILKKKNIHRNNAHIRLVVFLPFLCSFQLTKFRQKQSKFSNIISNFAVNKMKFELIPFFHLTIDRNSC